jgi:hypothetical protein
MNALVALAFEKTREKRKNHVSGGRPVRGKAIVARWLPDHTPQDSMEYQPSSRKRDAVSSFIAAIVPARYWSSIGMRLSELSTW